MAGADRRFDIPMTLTWSKGSDTVVCVLPVTAAIPTAGLMWVRPTSLTAMANSGSARVALGFQLADEDTEDQWTGTTALSAYLATESTGYDPTFQDLSTAFATKRFVRFVFMTKNLATVTSVETVFVGGALDLRNA